MCGIIGVVGSPLAARELYGGLLTLQHRGQDSAGILTSDETFHLIRNLGKVEKAIHKNDLNQLSGTCGIGHTRYATMGTGSLTEVQPHVLSFPFGIGMAHNGNIVNYKELVEDLRKNKRRHTSTKSDIEIIVNLFANYLDEASEENKVPSGVVHPPTIFEAVKKLMTTLEGAYSVVGVIAGHGLLAFRDPKGIRPLVLGKKDIEGKTAYTLCSESSALGFLGYDFVRDIKPGEAVFIEEDGTFHSDVLTSEKRKSCMFEWVYFASPESQLDGTPVYSARLAFGKAMARKTLKYILDQDLSVDLIVPVPDSSRPAAIALAESLRIPYREALIKNRYVQRTFILDSQQKREEAVQLKLSPVVSEFKGKNVLLVDDSIVRGTTSKAIVKMIRDAGAKKVYFASTCPPIVSPCYYGIDFPFKEELVAFDRKIPEIKKEIGVDELIYNDISDIYDSLKTQNLCMACLGEPYPTSISKAIDLQQDRQTDRDNSKTLH